MASAGIGTTAGKEHHIEPTPIETGPLIWDNSVGPQPLGFGPDAAPVVLDWYGRGEPDLLVTARGGPLGHRSRIYRPVSTPSTDQGPPVFDEGDDVPALDGLRLPCPITNGRDSRFDLVAMATEGPVYLKNTGRSNEPRFGDRLVLDLPPDLGLGNGRVSQMTAIDWDGDGRTDLVIGFDHLEDYWPLPDVPPTQQVGLNDRGTHPGFDRSGKWRGKAPIGRLYWLRNVGEPGAPRFEPAEPIDADGPLPDLAIRPAALLLGWGPSRSVELVVTDETGTVRLYRNFGGQLPPVVMEPRPLRDEQGQPLSLPDDRTTITAADLDRDHRDELVLGVSDGRIFAIHAGRERDSGRMVGPMRQEGRTVRLGGGSVLTAGDLDADGGLDLLYGDAPGRLHWLLDLGGPGDHRYDAATPIESGGVPFRFDPGTHGRLLGPIEPALGHACPLLIDWKQNGRPDLIVSGAGGEVLFLRNNGHETQPRFDVAEPIRYAGGPLILPPRVRPAAIDWSGHGGLPDLIAPDLQGLLCVWPRADSPLEVGEPGALVDRLGRLIRLDGGFGQGGRCCLWAGPWTGSGRPDLIIGFPRASRFIVPAITGEPLEDLDDVPNVLLLENLGRGVLQPRPFRLSDGRPLIVGFESCSPNGVDWSGRGSLDLLIGADDGSVHLLPREHLRW